MTGALASLWCALHQEPNSRHVGTRENSIKGITPDTGIGLSDSRGGQGRNTQTTGLRNQATLGHQPAAHVEVCLKRNARTSRDKSLAKYTAEVA